MLHVEAFAIFERHIWVYNDINKHMKQICFLFHRHFKHDERSSVMGDITIFGQNSLNLNFEHCVN